MPRNEFIANLHVERRRARPSRAPVPQSVAGSGRVRQYGAGDETMGILAGAAREAHHVNAIVRDSSMPRVVAPGALAPRVVARRALTPRAVAHG